MPAARKPRLLPIEDTAPTLPLELFADGVLSVDHAAAFLDLERSRIYDLMRDGTLPWVKVGRFRRIPRRALSAYLQSLQGK